MSFKTYHFKNIVNINQLGLTYMNERNESSFIQFDVCRLNWKKYASHIFNCELENITVQCVGQRNIADRPAFIEFFSDERIRFFFPMKKKWYEKLLHFPSSELNDFHRIQLKINEVGYTTYDLS